MFKPSKRKITVYSVWILRILVGIVFIYSGFSKSIDPWGFMFKLEEYFALADFTLPRSITLLLAIGCSSFELISGLLMLFGSYRRSTPILMLLFMCVMTPLTAYLYFADPIADCGCFGDAIILTNGETFFKNIALTAAIFYLCFRNYKVLGLISGRIGWSVVAVGLFYSLFIALVGYNIQPFVDFRPYPEGGPLVSSESDDESTVFIYSNGLEQKEFSIENLPVGDEWEFIDRIDSEASNGPNLSLFDSDGDDVLPDLIEDNKRFFLLVIPELVRADISGTFYVNELQKICTEKGIGFFGAISADSKGVEVWRDISLADYPIYTADDTVLKELVRGTMALVYVEDGVIKWKRTVTSLPDGNLQTVRKSDAENLAGELTIPIKPLFEKGTFVACLLLILILFMNQIKRFIGRTRQKRVEKDCPAGDQSSE